MKKSSFKRIVSEAIHDAIQKNHQEERRYAANISIYVYAKDDNEAVQKANMIARGIDGLVDDECRGEVTELVEIPFGSMQARQIKLNK